MTPKTLHQVFPEAIHVRSAGKCHCKRKGEMLSFQLPGDEFLERRDGLEPCGYFCALCGWSNAGARESEATP